MFVRFGGTGEVEARKMIVNDVLVDVPAAILKNWQEVIDVLARIVDVPAALVMRLNAADIEVFVSSRSEGNPYHVGDKEKVNGSGLYCETVMKTSEKLLVPNAMEDVNWDHNPDIKLGMISYFGFPILLPSGKPFGTICVLDSKQNEYSRNAEVLMQSVRDLIQSNIAMIYMNQVLGDENKRLNDYLAELQALRGVVPVCSNCKSIKDTEGNWHPVEHYLITHPKADFTHGICPNCMSTLYPEAGRAG